MSCLAHAIVCELDVSLVIQENVVQLQISVDDALFMQEVQSDTDFSSIKSVEEKREMQRMMCLSDLSSSATVRPKMSLLYTRKHQRL